MSAVIPLYNEGELKQFQKLGSYNNFNAVIYGTYENILPSIVSEPLGLQSTITSVKLYPIDLEKKYKIKTYADFLTTRGTPIGVSLLSVDIVEKDSKYYYVSNNFEFTPVESGLYEIVITDSNNYIFESDLFFMCGVLSITPLEVSIDATRSLIVENSTLTQYININSNGEAILTAPDESNYSINELGNLTYTS